MQDNAKVSIVMPSWNCGEFVEETIRSVQMQTYQNWEILFQDDCSTDDTREIVSRIAIEDSRVKYECNDRNQGAAITRNNALRRADGRWIAFLDSDDLWEPVKLERQVTFMIDNDYHFSYTNYKEIDADSSDMGVLVSGPKTVNKLMMHAFCWPGCLTVMYEREYVGLVQIEDIRKNNDYAMWLKVIEKANCYLLDECLAKYRRGRAGSVSTHSYATLIRWHYKLWHESARENVISSLFWTGMNLCFGVIKKILYVKRSGNAI